MPFIIQTIYNAISINKYIQEEHPEVCNGENCRPSQKSQSNHGLRPEFQEPH